MEFDQSPDNLLCLRTGGSEQEQKATHQGNCRLWEDREKWTSELTETSG